MWNYFFKVIDSLLYRIYRKKNVFFNRIIKGVNKLYSKKNNFLQTSGYNVIIEFL